MSADFGLRTRPNPGSSETSILPPMGMGSLRKRSPKTGWIDLPSGELAMYSQKGEWVCVTVLV